MPPIHTATYQINHLTLAILPAKSIDYDSIIIKQNGLEHVRQTPLQLIKTACYNDWTTYEGRRQAVMHHTNFKQKVPIPVNICKRIYLFPTTHQQPLDRLSTYCTHFKSTNIKTNSTGSIVYSF